MMESLKLNFDTEILGEPRTFIVEVPYQEGIVATSEFCPTELLSGTVDLMAAVRGESLDKFMADCRKQLHAMAKITEFGSELDLHIAGLMAVVMDHLARCGRLIFGDLLIYMDCFSLLLEADGFQEDEIKDIYPRVTRTIVELYPDHIFNTMDLSPFKGSHFDFVLSNLTHK